MMNRPSNRASRVGFKSYTAFTGSKLDLLKQKLKKPEEEEFYIIQTTQDLYENEIGDFEYYLDEELYDRDEEDVAPEIDPDLVEEFDCLDKFISCMVIDRSQGDHGLNTPEWHIIYKYIEPKLPKDEDIVMHFKEKIYGWRCLRNLYRTLVDIPSRTTFVCGVLQPPAMGMKTLERHLLDWFIWRETQRLNGGIIFRGVPNYIEIVANSFKIDSWERALYNTPSEEFDVSDEEITVQYDDQVKGLLKGFDPNRRGGASSENTKTIKIAEPDKSLHKQNVVLNSCTCQKKESRGIQATESLIDADIVISRIVIRPDFYQEKPGGLVSENYRRASVRRSSRISSFAARHDEDDEDEESILLDSDKLGLKSKVTRASRFTKEARMSRVDPGASSGLPIEAGVLIITDKNSIKIWERHLAPNFECEIYETDSDEPWTATRICDLDIILTTFKNLIESKKQSDVFFKSTWFRIMIDDDTIFQSPDDYKTICGLNYYAGYIFSNSNATDIDMEDLYECFRFLRWPTWNFDAMWFMYKRYDTHLNKQIKLALAPIFFSFENRESIGS